MTSLTGFLVHFDELILIDITCQFVSSTLVNTFPKERLPNILLKISLFWGRSCPFWVNFGKPQ